MRSQSFARRYVWLTAAVISAALLPVAAGAVSLNVSNGMPATNVLGQPSLSDGHDPSRPVDGTSVGVPYAAAFDPDHNRLFVTDTFVHRVLVFDLTDGIQNNMPAAHVLGQANLTDSANGFENPVVGCTGFPNACSLNFPYSLAYDRAHQRLFVGDYGTPRILAFDLAGGITDGMPAAYVLGQADFSTGAMPGDTEALWFEHSNAQNPAFGCTTEVNACGIRFALDLAYDEAGQRLFVADLFNNRVLVFELAGGIQNGMPAAKVIGQPDLTHGSVDSDVPNFVASSNAPNPAFGCAVGVNACGLNWPMSVAYDPTSQQLFVGEQQDRITVFDLSGGIVNGMPATHVLGQNSLTETVRYAFGQNTIHLPIRLAVDASGRRLYAAEWSTRVLVWDIANGVTDGMNAFGVLGQPDFTTSTSNTACGGGSSGAVNACGVSFTSSLCVDEIYGRVFYGDGIISRILVFGLAVGGVPVVIGGTGDGSTATAAVNPDGSTTISFSDAGGTADFAVTLPADTAAPPGESSVSIEVYVAGPRDGIRIDAVLPPGATKTVVLPIEAASNTKLCVRDRSDAQFGGTSCVGGDKVDLPAPGQCLEAAVGGDPGDNGSPSGSHAVQLCQGADGLTLAVSGLLHTVLELLPDSDGDGVIDDDDRCPGTALDGPIPTVSLRIGNLGDGQVIYGCNASQILECKPGNNVGETKFGLTPGSQNVFANGVGWAAACHQ